jgi:hypothetical protein
MGMTSVVEAPVAPITQLPSGVVRIDIPLFMKLVEAHGGADAYKIASLAARKCSDDNCVIGIDDFEGMTSECATGDCGAPGMGAPGDVPALPPPSDMPDASAPSDVPEISDGAVDDEVTDNDIPAFMNGGEEASVDEDPVGSTDESASVDEDPASDGPPESVKESKDEDGDGVDDDEEDDLKEAVMNLKPLNEIPVPAAPSAPKPIAEEKEEKKDEEEEEEKDCDKDCPLAEHMSRLTRVLSGSNKLVFKETRNPQAVEFSLKGADKFNQVFTESLTKVLANKTWLKDNGFDALTKYGQAAVVKAGKAEDRHFLVLK